MSGRCRLPRHSAEKVDNAVAQFAAEQWGVLSLADLRTCGLSDDMVSDRVKSGRLHRLHRGVYAVGHPNVPLEGRVPIVIDGRRVIPDFRWPAQRLVVEADGAAWHDDGLAREDDAERQALLEAHGERVVRVTWHQATRRKPETLARLLQAGAPTLPDA
jgi:hypothetical protein